MNNPKPTNEIFTVTAPVGELYEGCMVQLGEKPHPKFNLAMFHHPKHGNRLDSLNWESEGWQRTGVVSKVWSHYINL